MATTVAVVAALIAARSVAAQSGADSATILISLLNRPIGREAFQVRIEGQSVALNSDLDLLERGATLRVVSSLRARQDLTPIHFSAHGKTYRFVNVDVDVDVENDTAHIGFAGQQWRVPLPSRFYTALGYAPLAGRAQLIAYWIRHGRAATIQAVPGLPTREVRIEFRGTDSLRVKDRLRILRRYSVEGIVWGRETVWLDERDRFAGIVTRIHILPLEGVRAEFKDVLPAMQASSIQDRMRDLAQLGRRLPVIAAGTYALTGATVIDGTGRPALDDATIVVRGERIVSVGPRRSTPVPHGAKLIDARGTTVIPGLWDMHAHAGQIEWAPAYLAAGVTTIRDMGGEEDYLLAFRQTIASHAGAGPRVFLSGLVDGDSPGAFGSVVAATSDQGRAVVDHYHSGGFDQMKLYTLIQPDVARAIISRAQELGMTVTGHVPSSMGPKGAVEAGMDHIAHLPVSGEPDEADVAQLIALLARTHTVVDPTIPWNELLGRPKTRAIEDFEPGIAYAPQPLVLSYRSVRNEADSATATRQLRLQLELIGALHRAGVPIVAGTDGAVPGVSLLRSLELFVAAGLTPEQALQTATVVPARAMGVLDDVGTIEAGKRADLLVLEANPLEDIANLRKSRWVVANGQMRATAGLWRLAGFSSPKLSKVPSTGTVFK